MHIPYVCGFAWSDIVHGCMAQKQQQQKTLPTTTNKQKKHNNNKQTNKQTKPRQQQQKEREKGKRKKKGSCAAYITTYTYGQMFQLMNTITTLTFYKARGTFIQLLTKRKIFWTGPSLRVLVLLLLSSFVACFKEERFCWCHCCLRKRGFVDVIVVSFKEASFFVCVVFWCSCSLF